MRKIKTITLAAALCACFAASAANEERTFKTDPAPPGSLDRAASAPARDGTRGSEADLLRDLQGAPYDLPDLVMGATRGAGVVKEQLRIDAVSISRRRLNELLRDE